jgi:alpha-ribazole phosphatase
VGARTTLIYLLRHGEVVQAQPRRFIGHLDVPLSATGERQCEAQARRLAGVRLAAVFTSDLSRARRSGEIVGAPHGLTPTTVPALREMAMGRWDGLTSTEIEAREPDAFKTWRADVGSFAFPEGESVGDLLARAWPAFLHIARAHRGETVAVVAHGGTNRAVLCTALGLSMARILSVGQDYAALNVVEGDDDGWCLHRLNESPLV